MANFAKLFEGTEFGQILVTTDASYEDDEGETLWPVAIRGEDYKDCVITMSMGYRHEAEQATIFAGISVDEACNAVRHARQMIDQLFPDAPVEEKSDG